MTIKDMLLLAAALAIMPAARAAQPIDPKVQARIDRILKATPLIDGHNDLAEQLRENYELSIEGLASGTDQRQPHPLMTDMARLHAGPRRRAILVGLHPGAKSPATRAIRDTLEQIDIVKRLVEAYPQRPRAGPHRRRRRPHPQGRARSPR